MIESWSTPISAQMASLLLLVALVTFALLHFNVIAAKQTDDLTRGFISLPLNRSYYHFHKPYNLPVGSRYRFNNGIHKLWVLSTDEPLSKGSPTLARSEIIVKGYQYSAEVWQFEGHVYVPSGTSGVCIMQIFCATLGHSALMLRVYNGALMYYRRHVLADDIHGKSIKVNVIHDVGKHQLKVYINGDLKLETGDNGGNSYYFKFGVYTQEYSSFFMESMWKGVRVLRLAS